MRGGEFRGMYKRRVCERRNGVFLSSSGVEREREKGVFREVRVRPSE